MANIQSIITNVNGNVLIGTTTDSGYKFQVNGNAAFALNSGGLRIDSYDGNTANIRPTVANGSILISDDSGTLDRGTEFLNGGGVIIKSLNNFDPLNVQSNGSLVLLAKSNGDVGIGTDTFTDYSFGSKILKIAGTRATLGLTSSGSLATIAMIANSDPTKGIHMNLGSSGSFAWYQYSAGATTFTLAASGNLLLGTETDSGYKLYVNGNTAIGDSLYVAGVVRSGEYNIANTGGTAQWIKLGTFVAAQGGNTIYVRGYVHAGYNAVNGQDYYFHLFFKTSNGNSVDANGFAGNSYYYVIGNNASDPSPKWVANSAGVGATAFTLYIYAPSFTLGSHYVVEYNNVGGLNTWLNETTTASDPGAASSTVCIAAASFNVLYGNVGIGTTSPSNKLTVYQGGGVRVTGISAGDYIELSGNLPGYADNTYPVIKSNGSIHFANNGKYAAFLEGANTYFGILDNSANTRVFLTTSGASYLTGGNILIGTTTDNGRKLNVSGDIFASGEIYSNQIAQSRYIRYVFGGTNFAVGAGTGIRWVIGRIYWNQVHWGAYSGMDIEIVWNYYNGARKKYTISNGANGGGIYLRESQSYGSAYARVSLGSAVDTGTTSGGYINYYQDVYLDVNEYNQVSVIGELKGPQISIDKTSIGGGEYGWATLFSSPSASNISPFTQNAATILSSEGNWGYIDNKLGINVANPSYELDVYAASTPVIRLSSNNSSGVGNPIFIMARGGEETFKLAVDPNVGAIFRTVVANAGYMDFYTGTDSLTLRMSANKNLLIGTTTDPGYRLYVLGSTGGQLGSPSTNATAFNFGDTSRALTYMPTVGGGNYNVASVVNGSALFNTLGSDWWVGNHDGSALRFVQNSSLVFYTNSGAQGIWNSTGLGVGTISPTTRIDARDNPTSTNGVIQATPTYSSGSYFTAFRAVPSDTGDQGNYKGLFMGSISSDNALITSGSVYYSAGQYLPGGTTSTGIGLGGGTFTVFGNTGLTAGTQFAPTARMQVIGSTGNVIIGNTTDAGFKLDVYGEILGRDDIRILNTYAVGFNGSDDNWRMGRNTIADSGWLTLNTLQIVVFGGESGQGFQVVNHTGTAYFEINGFGGAARFSNSLGVGVNPSGTTGRIDASNDIVAYSSSDLRLKENIKPIENALDKVKSLTGVEFDWKAEHKEAHGYEGHDTGVIAQEVQEVMPTAVRTNDTGYLAVRYEKLIGLLIEANKELANRVEYLESKLK